ncbi:MAG: hypothetical protein COA78_18945 [Blastopirellula sp.]|nr:MAG: hypothetical protein COA78_18945 [Blastopirellula sp.]
MSVTRRQTCATGILPVLQLVSTHQLDLLKTNQRSYSNPNHTSHWQDASATQKVSFFFEETA